MSMYVFEHLGNVRAGNLGKISEHVFSNYSVNLDQWDGKLRLTMLK